jgi:hypothetical protein
MELTPEEKQKIIDEGVAIGLTRAQEKHNKEKGDLQKKLDEMKDLTERLQNAENLTKEEKKQLESQLEEMKNANLTAEQRVQSKFEKQIKDLTKRQETLESEGVNWKKRYEQSTIYNAISEAASQAKAFSPTQVVSLLAGNSKLVEKLGGDGKGTGEFEVVVAVKVPKENGKDGEFEVKDLPAHEAVKSFMELPENYNLSVSQVTKNPTFDMKNPVGLKNRVAGMSAEEIQAHGKELLNLMRKGALKR